MMGYVTDKRYYCVYNPSNGQFYKARDVEFDEQSFFTSEELLANAKMSKNYLTVDDKGKAVTLEYHQPHLIIYDEIVVERNL
jgi:hypothetical protein